MRRDRDAEGVEGEAMGRGLGSVVSSHRRVRGTKTDYGASGT